MRARKLMQLTLLAARRCMWRAGARAALRIYCPSCVASNLVVVFMHVRACSDSNLVDMAAATACALLLLERGCDFNLRDNFKCTALHRAAGAPEALAFDECSIVTF